jgi:ABC-type Na+ transport system ATPase subunit NatA
LIKFADYVESNIRKFILEQRKKNRKKLFNSSVLQEARNDADKVTKGVELLIVNV